MSDERKRPPSTRAVAFGQELPKPDGDIYGKTDPLPEGVVAKLCIETGPRAHIVATINKSLTVLGRGSELADLDVGDQSASRRHAYIAYRDGAFTLSDMGSTNGTYFKGELVGTTNLEHGDQFQIGTAVIRFELHKK